MSELAVMLPHPHVVCVCTLYAAVSPVPVVAFLPYIIPVLWSIHRSPVAKSAVMSVAICNNVLFATSSISYILHGLIFAIGNTVQVVQANEVSASFPIIAPILSNTQLYASFPTTTVPAACHASTVGTQLLK